MPKLKDTENIGLGLKNGGQRKARLRDIADACSDSRARLCKIILNLASIATVLVTFLGVSTADDTAFPRVKGGIWELSAERTLPGGNVQTWIRKARHCQNPSLLFQGYWGLAGVEKGGCRFKPMKMSESRYRIDSECMLRGAGKAVAESKITLTGDSAFEMEVDVFERGRHFRATESGRLIADCVQ